MKEGSTEVGSGKMEVTEKRGRSAHIFSWLHHPLDVTQPAGLWQCGLTKQSARLEL